MWVLIDNYDSFTHILHHYLLLTGNECMIVRNDALTIEQLIACNPTRLIISPGPCTPLQAGISMSAIEKLHKKIPILGVCLGHQALGMFFGAELIHATQPVHGKTSLITHNSNGLFQNIPSPTQVMRYHSLVLNNLEHTELIATAHTVDNTIMAMQHRLYPCIGMQFHPESVGTEHGMQMIQNWANDNSLELGDF